MKRIDWRAELAKWIRDHPMVPGPPLCFRDSSGVFAPEFYKEVMEQAAEIAKEIEQ